MKFRPISTLMIAALAAGCGGDAADTEAVTQESAVSEASPDEMAMAALAELRESYATHYNLHHASMVADHFTDEATALFADGAIVVGRDEIIENTERLMAASPTVSIDGQADMIFGDYSVSRGEYSVDVTPEGAPGPVTIAGAWMGLNQKVGDEWKIQMLVTNYNAPPAEGFEYVPSPEDAPDELTEGSHFDLASYYQTHYNMGHASMVADLYAEDAVAALPNQAIANGRAAIEAGIAPNTEAGAQLTIHPVMAQDLGDGHTLGAGWYEITGGPAGDATGVYMTLTEDSGEGLPTIKWGINNARPAI